jgi:hypothetical protein
MPGTSTFPVELSNVSQHGLWLLAGDEELFLPFEHFPWFKTATIEQISTVERPTADHLYWPRLDIDLSVDSVRNPSAFPLVSRHVPSANDGTDGFRPPAKPQQQSDPHYRPGYREQD